MKNCIGDTRYKKAPVVTNCIKETIKKGQKIMLGIKDLFGGKARDDINSIKWKVRKMSTEVARLGVYAEGTYSTICKIHTLVQKLSPPVDDNQKDIVALGEGQKAIREYLEGLEKRLDGLERIVLENAGIAQVEAD